VSNVWPVIAPFYRDLEGGVVRVDAYVWWLHNGQQPGWSATGGVHALTDRAFGIEGEMWVPPGFLGPPFYVAIHVRVELVQTARDRGGTTMFTLTAEESPVQTVSDAFTDAHQTGPATLYMSNESSVAVMTFERQVGTTLAALLGR
jgi:hypothetical protein